MHKEVPKIFFIVDKSFPWAEEFAQLCFTIACIITIITGCEADLPEESGGRCLLTPKLMLNYFVGLLNGIPHVLTLHLVLTIARKKFLTF